MPISFVVRTVVLWGAILLSTAHAAPELLNSPIPLNDASGKTPPVATETEPCPFLSDKTAQSAVWSRKPLPRASVSNTECVWKHNIGIKMVVAIEPAASARPFAERHYNMDGKTQLDALAGPGTDAVLLSHTTWGKPIAYALGFKLDDKSVFIYAMGLKTSGQQLQLVANEVAHRLPGAKNIEAQERATRPAFDNCTTWTPESLAGLLGLPAAEPVTNRRGNTYCNWLFGKKGSAGYPREVSVSYARHSKSNWKRLQKKRGATLLDGFAQPVLRFVIKDDFGHVISLTAQLGEQQVSVSVTNRSGKVRDTHVTGLMNNLLARLER